MLRRTYLGGVQEIPWRHTKKESLMTLRTALKLNFSACLCFVAAISLLSASSFAKAENAEPIRTGTYKSVAGASVQINIGPWAGSGPDLTIMGNSNVPVLPLRPLSANELEFKGKGCVIRISGIDTNLIQVSQKGPCEYYGFGLEMDLSGPFVAAE